MDPVAAGLAALCPDAPPRAWSLIVTVFGDTGGQMEISAGHLQDILEPLGVSAAALRVAIHRLKADGWIVARRVGRSSAYRLHPDRLAEARAAHARIYAADAGGGWQVRVAGDSLVRPGCVQIAPQVWLCPKGGRAGGDLLLSGTDGLPDWARDALAPPELQTSVQSLKRGLETVLSLTDGALTPLQTHSLRVLVVHEWRRLVLRLPDLPDAIYPEACPVAACRATVMTLFAALPRFDGEGIKAGFP